MTHLETILIILMMVLPDAYVTENSKITDYLQDEKAEFAFLSSRNGFYKNDDEPENFLARARVIEEYRKGNRVTHILMNEVPVLKHKRQVEIKDCNRVLNTDIMKKILRGHYEYNINKNETKARYQKQVSVEIKIKDSDSLNKTYSFKYTQTFSTKCPAISYDHTKQPVLIYLSEIAELESGNAQRYTFVYQDPEENNEPVQILALINNKILYNEKEFNIIENLASLNEMLKSSKKVYQKINYIHKAQELPTVVVPITSDLDYYVNIIKKLKYYSIDRDTDTESDKKIYKKKAQRELGEIPFALPKEYLDTEEIYFMYLTSLYGFVRVRDDNMKHIVKSLERLMSDSDNKSVSESPFTISIVETSSELLRTSVCSRIIALWQLPLDIQLFQMVDDTDSNQVTLEKKQIEFSDYHTEFNNLISLNVIKCPPLVPKKGKPKRPNIYFQEVLLKDHNNENELTIVYTDVETGEHNVQKKKETSQQKGNVQEREKKSQENDKDSKNKDIDNSNDNRGKIKILFSLSNKALDYKKALKDFLNESKIMQVKPVNNRN